jgi:hypothetical protein
MREIFDDREIRKTMRPSGLCATAATDNRVRRQTGDVCALEVDHARPRFHEAGDGAQVVLLPAPLAPIKRHDLALFHLQRNTVERADRAVVHVEIADFKHRPLLSEIRSDHLWVARIFSGVPSAIFLP